MLFSNIRKQQRARLWLEWFGWLSVSVHCIAPKCLRFARYGVRFATYSFADYLFVRDSWLHRLEKLLSTEKCHQRHQPLTYAKVRCPLSFHLAWKSWFTLTLTEYTNIPGIHFQLLSQQFSGSFVSTKKEEISRHFTSQCRHQATVESKHAFLLDNLSRHLKWCDVFDCSWCAGVALCWRGLSSELRMKRELDIVIFYGECLPSFPAVIAVYTLQVPLGIMWMMRKMQPSHPPSRCFDTYQEYVRFLGNQIAYEQIELPQRRQFVNCLFSLWICYHFLTCTVTWKNLIISIFICYAGQSIPMNAISYQQIELNFLQHLLWLLAMCPHIIPERIHLYGMFPTDNYSCHYTTMETFAFSLWLCPTVGWPSPKPHHLIQMRKTWAQFQSHLWNPSIGTKHTKKALQENNLTDKRECMNELRGDNFVLLTPNARRACCLVLSFKLFVE